MPFEASTTESVYILDDDPSILKAVQRLLAAEGITARAFSDPADFLASAQAHSAPVAVLDVWMERINGLEVQFKLKRLSPQTRIITMTGRNDAGVKQTAAEMGAVAFFVKPFDDEEFISAIRRVLPPKQAGPSAS